MSQEDQLEAIVIIKGRSDKHFNEGVGYVNGEKGT